MDVRIPKEDRQRIVTRLPGGVSVIRAAEIQNPDQLAYAIRFLTDHYTYKRSKDLGAVNMTAAEEAAQAAEVAALSFSLEVLGIEEGAEPVSGLAEGKIVNPFAYVA